MGSYNSINFTKLIVNGIPYNKAYMGSKILFENNHPFTLEITGYKDGNTRASLYYRKGNNPQENCTFYIKCGNTTYTKRSKDYQGSYLQDDNNNKVLFHVGDKINVKVVYDNNDTPVVGSGMYGAGIALSGCYYKVYGDLSTYNANGYYAGLLSTGNSGGVTCNGLTDISGIIWPDTVSQFCYYYMFSGQSNLTQAVDLPATTLATRCYTRMFGNTGVTDITMHALDYSSQDSNKLQGGFNSFVMTDTQPINGGVFRLPKGNNLGQFAYIENRATNAEDQKWTIQTFISDYSQEYFTIQSLEDNNTITFTKYNQKNDYITADKPIKYSKDLTTWTDISFVTDNSSQIVLNSGEKLYLKGTNSAYGELLYYDVYLSCANIQSSGNIDVMGNIMSLVYGDNFINNNTIESYAFPALFKNNNKLVNAKDLILPATTLALRCYKYMFSGCTSLVTPPELPATTLAIECYHIMFSGCTSLVTPPELPATTLATRCYEYMFSGCTSLVTAPELPATYLVNFCYKAMFTGCTSLNYIKAMFTSAKSNYSYTAENWLSNVSATGTFVKNSEATWDNSEWGIPTGWTVETASE